MSLSTEFMDKGQKTRVDHIKDFNGLKATAVTYQTFLQTISAAKVTGGELGINHAITTAVTNGAYDLNSTYCLCEFIHPVFGLFKFALRTPKDSTVEFNADISRYVLTAAAVTTLSGALETAMGLSSGDLIYRSGILHVRPRKQKP
jgi:hypothetical protein